MRMHERYRERVYRLELRPLGAVEEFIAELRGGLARGWERRLMAPETEVPRVKRESKKRGAVTRVADRQRVGRKGEAG
jgi:hypothetical protein